MTMNFVLRIKNKFFVNKVYWGIVKYFREQDKFFHWQNSFKKFYHKKLLFLLDHSLSRKNFKKIL